MGLVIGISQVPRSQWHKIQNSLSPGSSHPTPGPQEPPSAFCPWRFVFSRVSANGIVQNGVFAFSRHVLRFTHVAWSAVLLVAAVDVSTGGTCVGGFWRGAVVIVRL